MAGKRTKGKKKKSSTTDKTDKGGPSSKSKKKEKIPPSVDLDDFPEALDDLDDDILNDDDEFIEMDGDELKDLEGDDLLEGSEESTLDEIEKTPSLLEEELDDIEEELDEDEEDDSDKVTDEEEEPEPEDEDDDEPGVFQELYERVFGGTWEMWVGAVLLSVLSIMLFVIKSPWGASTGIWNIGMNAYHLLGISFTESASGGSVLGITENRYSMLIIMSLVGALGSALLSRDFALRIGSVPEMAKGLIGGLLMGVGFVLAVGCTIGSFYSSIPALSAGALVFGVGLVAGVYVAVRYNVWEIEKLPRLSTGRTFTLLQAKGEGMSWQPIAGVIILVLGAAVALLFDWKVDTEKVIIGFILVGLLIGVILQRSRFCIYKALREPFLTCDPGPSEAVMLGLVVATLGFTVIKWMGIRNEMFMVEPTFFIPGLLGGVIFGFGMVIAGGCTVGSVWRAGEGRTRFWLALLGMMISAPLFGEFVYPHFMDILPSWAKQQVFMPQNLTYPGSVVLVLVIILLWYFVVNWNARTGRLSVL